MSELHCRHCNAVIHDATQAACSNCGYSAPFILKENGIAITDKPKDKQGKYQPHLLCNSLTEAIARVREYGVLKYNGENGWKQQTMLDYMDAVGRHYDACRNDPLSRDEESGLLHICQIATDAMFIIDMLAAGGVDIASMKEPPK